MFFLQLLDCQTSIQFNVLLVLIVFILKFVVILLLVVQEAQCVYLRLHLGQKSVMEYVKLDVSKGIISHRNILCFLENSF